MKINQLKTGVILSYLTTIVGALVSMAYTPAMLRLLGQSEYGLYTLAGSVVGYLNLLNFGLSSAYVRFYSRYNVNNDKDGIARLNGMFMVIFSVLGIIALTAGLILSASADVMFSEKLTIEEIKITKILIAILSFNIALAFPFNVFSAYITVNEKFVFHKLLALIKTIISPMLTLLVLLLGFRSIGMVVITVLVHILTDIAYYIYAVKKLHIKFCFKNFNFSLLKEVTSFSSFIFINIIVDQINWNVAKFLLGIYHGAIATSIYGAAAQLHSYYQQIPSMISSVFVPRVHRLVSVNDNEGVNFLFKKVGRIQFIVIMLICTGFVFFGKPFIKYWAGPNFSDSYYITLLMFFPLIVPLIQNLGIEIQRALNLHKFRSLVYIGIAIVNLLISIPLCKLYQGIGCAIGTAISLIVGNSIIMNIYYYKKCGINIIAFWKTILQILPSMIIPIIAGVVINLLIKDYSLITLVLGIIIYSLVYITSAYLFGMNEYEKSLIKSPLKRIFRRRLHD